ncbi:putative phosphatase yihX [Aspergillus nomiae NRRL 13137]|uniref:Putative phosphatase yihX n=1 Tax=Aspergillus nomiae NRRL (strain ATCC 15546 / NRRL 13137 / CBS 260.88 / M93) TaxID=1509407 RepID=A0A0L1J6C4_ASPN3|nr:putative phosphatase yihX [Aspergillus nomiae NRRL 13137]KNG87292.1 putative phosphatase yihX [Aspergillus nomiae NRRL 13137]
MSSTFKAVIFNMGDETWEEFERGRIAPDDCYYELRSHIGFPGSEIAAVLRQNTGSLRPDARMTSLLRELKDKGVALRTMHYEWDLFDGIFASALEGMRKPDVEFYEHVLKRINTPAAETIFVDDQLAKVAATPSVDMVGLHCTDSLVTYTELRQLAAGRLLYRNASR